jgi:peptidoglycan/LPS O-acetylase OafA/YrhL
MALAFAIRAALIGANDLHLESAARNAIWVDAFVSRPYARFGGLLCGVIGAYLVLNTDVREQLARFRLRPLLSVLAFLCIFDMAFRQQPIFVHGWPPLANFAYYTTSTYLFSIAICYLFLLSLGPSWEGRALCRLLSARWLYVVGQLSYSGYLLHLMLIEPAMRVGALAPVRSLSELSAHIALIVVASVAVSALLYLCVERPLMNLR